MKLLNPFNLSTGNNLLFFFTVIQIVLNLETAGRAITALVKGIRAIKGLKKIDIIIYSVTGLTTGSILITGTLNLFGIFKRHHRLLVPNLVLSTMLILPSYLNLIFDLAHPPYAVTVLFCTILHTVDITAVIITGLMAYKEIKEEKTIEKQAKNNFGNVAATPEPIF